MYTFFTKQSNHLHRKKLAGFTLVEVLVSTALFTLAIGIGTLAVVTLKSAADKLRVQDQTIQSAYYVMDTLTRSIRTGYGYGCDTFTSTSVCSGQSSFVYHDQDQQFVELRLNSGILQYHKLGKLAAGATETPNMSGIPWLSYHDAAALKIRSISFTTIGAGSQTDDKQPMVTILATFEYSYRNTIYTIPFQTSITQRNIDVPYNEG